MAPRRFDATEATIKKELTATMRSMRATSLQVHQELLGKPRTEIVFDRAGRRYVFRCERYDHPTDNFRAAQLAIRYLYQAYEAYGVTTASTAKPDELFLRVFAGFEATPDDTVLLLGDSQSPWQVLGIDPISDKTTIVNAFRALARVHHPDNGGQAEDFQRIRRAYEQALDALEQRERRS